MACDFWNKLVKATCADLTVPSYMLNTATLRANGSGNAWVIAYYYYDINPDNPELNADILLNLTDYTFFLNDNELIIDFDIQTNAQLSIQIGDLAYQIQLSTSGLFQVRVQARELFWRALYL